LSLFLISVQFYRQPDLLGCILPNPRYIIIKLRRLSSCNHELPIKCCEPNYPIPAILMLAPTCARHLLRSSILAIYRCESLFQNGGSHHENPFCRPSAVRF
jgi:hypothetical protein